MVKTALWPFRPSPRDGESLSSWFTRLALVNGLRPTELLPVVLPGSGATARDFDRTACDALLTALARNTGVPRPRLEAMHFGRWQGRLFQHDHGHGVMPWFLPLRVNETRRPYGQQFCPCCLAGDETPYMRLAWRLGFVSFCPEHGTLLLDRCPACKKAVDVTALYPSGSISRCRSCGGDLTKAEAPPLDPAVAGPARLAQGGLLRMAEVPQWRLGEYGMVDTAEAFAVLLRLTQLLSASRTAGAFRAVVGAGMGLAIPPASIPRLRSLHMINPRGRAAIIAMGWWLLENWPRRFVRACTDTGIGARRLNRKHQRSPEEWVAPIVRHLTHRRDDKPAPVEPIPAPETKTPWGNHRYWKLDGVSADARAAVRSAARAEGENVGPWIERLIRKETTQSFIA